MNCTSSALLHLSLAALELFAM